MDELLEISEKTTRFFAAPSLRSRLLISKKYPYPFLSQWKRVRVMRYHY